MEPLDALLGLLSARFVLVVGKGGVGKTTTAGAIGVGLADRTAVPVHVVSTDPAHSLGHLFDQDLSGGAVAPAGCAGGLTLEEIDAGARGRAWLEDVSPGLAELVERGTYLDAEDVLGLLGPALPGMDEIMAAFRLVELAGEHEPRRVVVDTAPTGHLLRLLDAGGVLAGWTEALDAMAEKAAVVAGHFTGRRVRLAGEAVLDDIRRVMEGFSTDVVEGADVVVVTTPGAVVAAETERLVAELRRRKLRVVAVVRGEPTSRDEPEGPAEPVGRADPGGGGIALVRVPWTSEPRGCEGLRAWGTTEAPRPRSGGRPRHAASTAAHRLPEGLRALERPVLLFAGKGGVGKSTCAAAWGVHRAGVHPTLLLGADPAGSLSDVLAVPVEAGTTVLPGLEVRQVEAERSFTRFKEDYRARVEDVFRRLGLEQKSRLDRRVVASLLQVAPSGLDEIFGLDALLDALREEREVIVDGAPTGHFLRLMEMPDLALGWTHGLMRALLKYRAALGLDDVAERLLRVAREVRELAARLADPATTGVVVVTTDGALPVAETGRLLARLSEGGLPVAAVIHNRYSPGSAAHDVEAPEGALRVRAPRLDAAPVGVEALRSFVARWES